MKNNSEPKKRHDISFVTKSTRGDITTLDIHESDGMFIELFASEYPNGQSNHADTDIAEIVEFLDSDNDSGFMLLDYEPPEDTK